VTASIAWPDFYPGDRTEVDNQVAAPAVTRTPNLQRAKCSSTTADGRVATAASGQRENLVQLREKLRKQNYEKNCLTETGLLMEGVCTSLRHLFAQPG